MKDDDIIIKHEIKRFNLGNTKVEVTNLYDTINEIARNCERRGIDTSDWFYTDEEIEKMKKDPRYTFI